MSAGSYTVERLPRGLVIRGQLPLSDLVFLMEAWAEEGYEIADALLSKHLGVTLVLTTKEHSTAWRRELGLEIPTEE
jgi:hypothetical protein